jgi:hypothetical protein
MAKFLQDNEGNNSSMRLGYILWVVGVLVAWIGACVINRSLVAIPDSIIGVLGIAFGGKVAQSFSEK